MVGIGVEVEVEDDASMVVAEETSGILDMLDSEAVEDTLDSSVAVAVDAMTLDVDQLKMLSDNLVEVDVAAMSLDAEKVEMLEENPSVAYCVVEVARLQVVEAWLQVAMGQLRDGLEMAQLQLLKENSRRACPKEHVCATSSCQGRALSFQWRALRLACVSPLLCLALVAVQLDPGC